MIYTQHKYKAKVVVDTSHPLARDKKVVAERSRALAAGRDPIGHVAGRPALGVKEDTGILANDVAAQCAHNGSTPLVLCDRSPWP